MYEKKKLHTPNGRLTRLRIQEHCRTASRKPFFITVLAGCVHSNSFRFIDKSVFISTRGFMETLGTLADRKEHSATAQILHSKPQD